MTRAASPLSRLAAGLATVAAVTLIFGRSARSRWELIWRASTLDRFLGAAPDAAVQVVPFGEA